MAFSINTTTTTDSGITLSSGAIVQFIPTFFYGENTDVVYKYKCYKDAAALAAGDASLYIRRTTDGSPLQQDLKVYTEEQYQALSFSLMIDDVQELLEAEYGEGNVVWV